MLSKIDWMSFSVIFPNGAGQSVGETRERIMVELYKLDPLLASLLGIGTEGRDDIGRKPYSMSWHRDDEGLVIFYHPNLDHALVEISGKGCNALADTNNVFRVLEIIQPRMTRLDIASDMLTDTRPIDFVTERKNGRFKSFEHKKRPSGETYYVGSRTSNRFARVYRYEPPHERAHLLRVEVQTGNEDAKLTALSVLQNGVNSVAKSLGERFGWKHADWQPDNVTSADLKAWRPERGQGKTLFWLADTVAPLLRRLHNEQVIDVSQWFTENVLEPLLKPADDATDANWDDRIFDEIPF